MKRVLGRPVDPDSNIPIGPGVIIGKKAQYTVGEQLGSGGFGATFSAVSDQGIEVAVKVSRVRHREFRLHRPLTALLDSSDDSSKTPKKSTTVKKEMIGGVPAVCEAALRTEYHVMRRLEKLPGFPRPLELNVHGDETYLVMTRLGKSLRAIFEDRQHSFTLETTLKIMDQMLLRLEGLHSAGIIHGDLKPDNVLVGLGDDAGQLYLIDFGLSTMYKDPVTGQHLRLRNNNYTCGTPRYMSIHAHAKVQQSRRDDMEALGYMLAFFTRHGDMPWRQDELLRKDRGMMSRILSRKEETKAEALFLGQPREFAIFMEYAWRLEYPVKPEYTGFRKMFQRLGAIVGVNYQEKFL